MELLTIMATATIVVSFVAFLLFKLWNKDEDTFAKAMANKQITLLDDAAPKKNNDKKEKEKQQKKKEDKKKKAAAAAENKEDKAAVAEPANESPKPAKEEPAKSAKEESPKSVPKKEQPKPEEPKTKETPTKKESPVKKEKESVPAEPIVKKENVTPVQTSAPADPAEAKPAQQSNGTGQGSKKAKKAPKQVEEIENEEEFVEAKTKKNKKNEKKDASPVPPVPTTTTAPRHLSLKDLDTNKVVTRLAAIDEVEPEYIEYLNNFFRDTAINASAAAEDFASAQRKNDESGRALIAMKNEKAKMEQELESCRRTVAELAQKSGLATSAEMELRSKMAALEKENEKIRREADTLRNAAATAAAAVVVPPAPIVIDNKEEVEKLKAEIKTAANRIADLEDQLKNTKESAAKEKKIHEQAVLQNKTREDSALGQEVLLAESRQNAKAISQRLTEMEQLKETLEKAIQEKNKECEELKQREATLAADAEGFKKMIDDLNKEVHRFEEAKKELTEMADKLAAKESELQQQKKALEEAEQQINAIKQGSETASSAASADIQKLTDRVTELAKALEEAEKRASEVVIPVVEEKKDDVEEVVELKKSNYLDAAPPAVNGEEVENLKKEVEKKDKEIERLNEKNSVLRVRNHKMVDIVTDLEKRVMSNGVGAAPSTSAAPAAEKENSKKKGGKKEKEEKKGDEEEHVRAERRLVKSLIGKVVPNLPTLDDGADSKAYEQWLKTVASSVKSEVKKAEKSAKQADESADDSEKQQLLNENEALKDALAALELELATIEQLHRNELEKKHGKAH